MLGTDITDIKAQPQRIRIAATTQPKVMECQLRPGSRMLHAIKQPALAIPTGQIGSSGRNGPVNKPTVPQGGSTQKPAGPQTKQETSRETKGSAGAQR